MHRLLQAKLNSIHSMLGRVSAQTEIVVQERTEQVRQAMLKATPIVNSDEQHPNVFRRIYYADSIHDLWYARSDLMAAIAQDRGEEFARKEMNAISNLFDGLVPEFRSYVKSASPR